MTIYPTFLYIKQHSITGLKYFGKTTSDPYTYNGSGKHWKLHIKAHGKEHIETLWVSEPYTDAELISKYALMFSKDNNIIESSDWANLIDENGLDGFVKGATHSEETKQKISDSSKLRTYFPTGKPCSEETRQKLSDALLGRTSPMKGRTLSEETKQKLSDSMMGRTSSMKGRTIS